MRIFEFSHALMPTDGMRSIKKNLMGTKVSTNIVGGRIRIVLEGEGTRDSVQNEEEIRRLASSLNDNRPVQITILNSAGTRIGAIHCG